MNIKMIKIDPAKALSATVTILGIAGTLLSAKVQANERAEGRTYEGGSGRTQEIRESH